MKNTKGQKIYQRVMQDSVTGEQRSVMVIARDVVDTDFFKIFATDLLARVAEANTDDLPVRSVAKLIRFFGLLLALAAKGGEGLIGGTYRELSSTFGMEERTFTRYWGSLQRLDIIRRVRSGAYMLNPELFANVANSERIDLVTQYRRIKSASREDVPGQQTLPHLDDREESYFDQVWEDRKRSERRAS